MPNLSAGAGERGEFLNSVTRDYDILAMRTVAAMALDDVFVDLQPELSRKLKKATSVVAKI